MRIELIGQEDDLILTGVLANYKLYEGEEIFFFACGMYPLLNDLCFV
jgi:hypothetical protein